MRTTLNLDDDVLLAVKELAQIQKRAVGKIVSELARKALIPEKPPKFRNGIQLIEREPGEPVVTMELVNRLRDEE